MAIRFGETAPDFAARQADALSTSVPLQMALRGPGVLSTWLVLLLASGMLVFTAFDATS